MRKGAKLAMYALGGVAVLVPLLFEYVIAPSPRLVCSKAEYDFGVIGSELKLEHTFTLKNAGGRKLHIASVEVDCSCTSARVLSPIIEPGESTALAVTLHLDNYYGTVSGRVFVTSNDPVNPKTVFSISGERAKKLVVSPPLVEFSNLMYGKLADQTIDLDVLCREPKGLSLSVDDATGTLAVRARLSNLEGPGWPRITVSLDPKAPIGPLSAVIRVKEQRDQFDYDCVELPVRGFVTGYVSAKPDVAYLGVLRKSTPAKRIAIVSDPSYSPMKVTLEDVSSILSPFVEVSIEESKGLAYLNVEVRTTLTNPGHLPEVRGAVRLRCDLADGSTAVLNVPVYFFLQPT